MVYENFAPPLEQGNAQLPAVCLAAGYRGEERQRSQDSGQLSGTSANGLRGCPPLRVMKFQKIPQNSALDSVRFQEAKGPP